MAIHGQNEWYVLASECFEKPSSFIDSQWDLSAQLLIPFPLVLHGKQQQQQQRHTINTVLNSP